MEIRHDMNGITFSDEYSDITFKNEHEVMNALRYGNNIINKTIYMAARGNGRRCDDAADAMAYIANDILLTQQYSTYVKGLWPTKIEKVIFNNPATIILWTDGSKTVVKCSEDELFDPEKGLAMAICKKTLGYQFKKTFKEWLPKEYSEPMTISEAIEALRNIGNIFK